MKKTKQRLLILLCFIVYIYVCSISFLPNNIILLQGEMLNLNTLLGIKISQNNSGQNISYDVLQTSTENSDNSKQIGNVSLSLDLFGTIPLKEIDVSVIPKTKVVPLGTSIGLRLYTQGVLVVGMSEIKGEDNKKYKPYENSGIKEGDTIIAVNDKDISTTEELVENVNNSQGGSIEIEYINSNEDVITTNITPVKVAKNQYKLGLWVRDAAEGVGTATFYEPTTEQFAALGHPIMDVDTGDIINISNGELITSRILSILKGKKGSPGEIRGLISSGVKIGEISKNTSFGIFGKITQKSNLNITSEEAVDVAMRSEIKEGKAYVLCELEQGVVGQYEIEIQKIYSGNNYDNKSMLIKVTDEKLLEKTGGIVQGMSGSPIIQDGKFIRSNNSCFSFRPNYGICCVWRFDDKRNENS